jgi:hypothetical protein
LPGGQGFPEKLQGGPLFGLIFKQWQLVTHLPDLLQKIGNKKPLKHKNRTTPSNFLATPSTTSKEFYNYSASMPKQFVI